MQHTHLAFGFELKGLSEAGEFDGYGSVFNNIDSQKDIVMPGAFKASLAEHDKGQTWPQMLFQHDTRNPIGEWLEVREDSNGLYTKGRLWIDGSHPDAWAMKMYRAMKSARGKVGLSIGYSTVKSAVDAKTGVRRVQEVKLYEVSPVLFPANADARVEGVKSEITTLREFEAALRDTLGFSRKEAEAVAEGGFKAWRQIVARDERELGGHSDDTEPRDERGGVDATGISTALAELRLNIVNSQLKGIRV